jgi:hypothetical protein
MFAPFPARQRAEAMDAIAFGSIMDKQTDENPHLSGRTARFRTIEIEASAQMAPRRR